MTFLATEGYLVRWFNLSQEDRWFTFFTRDHGFLKVMVNHRKLEQTPSLAYPAPLDRGEITTLLRRHGPGTRLVEYDLRERHLWLAEDLEALGHAFLFLEALEELSAEEDPQPEAYRLMGDLLAGLGRGMAPAIVSQGALVQLFGILGYRLDLERCRRCREAPREKNLFVAAQGGFFHRSCAAGMSGLDVSPGTLRFLARLAGSALGASRRLTGDRRVTRESAELVQNYLHYLCQKRLDAEEFLRKVAAAGIPPAHRARGGERS